MLTMGQRIAVTDTVRKRYRRSIKKQKVEILNEFVSTTGYNRSYARRVLGSLKKVGRKKKYPPRKRVYDAQVFYALRKIWIISDNICGQRLKPQISEIIRKLELFKEYRFNKRTKQKLTVISPATIDRMLSATKKSYQLKGRSTTKPGTLLRQTIAVRTAADWSESERKPGFFETDLVAFCGESVRGDYINGLNLTDVFLGWVILEAVMGKGQFRIHKAIDAARKRLPYPMLGLDPDNGTEFINWLLNRYCHDHKLAFTRIRPNRKNDNCYVEQKNYTVLRRFLGYGRYDTSQQLMIIKELVKLIEVYVNFFQPVMKLTKKERIGNKVKKQYDTAKTPYQRLLESGVLNEEQKQKLIDYYEILNPADILRQIRKLQTKLYKTLCYKKFVI
jgi:hypothetical protein